MFLLGMSGMDISTSLATVLYTLWIRDGCHEHRAGNSLEWMFFCEIISTERMRNSCITLKWTGQIIIYWIQLYQKNGA